MKPLTVTAAMPSIAPGAFVVRSVIVRATWAATGSLGWRDLKPTMRAIAQRFSEDCGYSVAALTGPSRSAPLAKARQELMWLLRQQERWSLPQIGRFLGGRDHTTIIHGVRQHQRRLDEAFARLAA